MKQPLIIALIFICSAAFGQNLVPNGGFEDYSSLPISAEEWYLCTGWSNLDGFGTPDYLHTLGSGSGQLPHSAFATVYPHSGNALMGFLTFHEPIANWREYLSIQLSSPLVVGNSYKVSFWLTNGGPNHRYGNSSNHIGIKFSVPSLNQVDIMPVEVEPQLELPEEVWTTAWQFYSFNFSADSAYNHITVGNFYNDDSTSTTTRVNAIQNSAYYFIDDISVVTDTLNSVASYLSHLEAGLDVFPNPAHESIVISNTLAFKRISLYNGFGRLVYDEVINGKNEMVLPLIGLPVGYYQVVAKDGEGHIQTERIFKK